jgi:predicted NUDIX family phosphoesterase
LLEGDTTKKHIISYFVVFDPIKKKFLSYERTSHSGESRLVGQRSIGWGGHIGIDDLENVGDHKTKQLFFDREFYEELKIGSNSHIKILSNIFNEQTQEIHLGPNDFLVQPPNQLSVLFDFDKINSIDFDTDNGKNILNFVSELIGNEFMLLSDRYYMLNDNTTLVGKVHLGIVHILLYFNRNNNDVPDIYS